MSEYLGNNRVSDLWSKIKEKLSKKQDVLTGDPGQLIGIGDDGAATATVYPCNKNLLDNWYFADPINQRSVSIWDNGYGIDRWSVTPGFHAEINDKGVHISGNGWLLQRTELTWNNLVGKKMTASILTADGELFKGTTIISEAESIDAGKITLRFQRDYGNLALYIGGSKRDCSIIAAKLELGSIQTLAHKEGDTWVLNDPLPNKALELAKCQRYYWKSDMEFIIKDPIEFGSGYIMICNVQFPVPMCKRPTVTIVSLNGAEVMLSYASSRIDSNIIAFPIDTTLNIEGFSALGCSDIDPLERMGYVFHVVADADL